ncbi:MAG: bifunctional phosphopantothenoylcysteine decarboxylase/phosphopantothenate--cysteine ligase CoaBC [Pseudomonadales bacterium]|nr:bifunctional phosphopantothenoylcysteine decarboxylase/phosphopantothenate--cysteine ligase CoaBC [Pseudomonadales bacterium]
MSSLQNKRILLGVTGGIAAYKSAELLRRLQDEGADVRVVMTRGATEFITPLTMQALSGHEVHIDLLDTESERAMGHIDLARWADMLVIAPATANFLASLVAGKGDDLLSTICLAAMCPVAVAPAMNQAMWANPSTQANCRTLQDRGIIFFGPEAGLQACGETGSGRLLAVPELVACIAGQFQSGLLNNRTVLITAGPTREAIDPVRYISNHSSGKQGYALAEAAAEAGARVILVSGPVNLPPPDRVEVVPVVSADEMYAAVMARVAEADVFIGVAAVADFKPVASADQKIKKQDGSSGLTLELTQNPDIIAAVAALPDGPVTVGFAAETQNLLDYARSKLTRKNLDMIVANDVSNQSIGFNSDENETTIISRDDAVTLPMASKRNISANIIRVVSGYLDTNHVPFRTPAGSNS